MRVSMSLLFLLTVVILLMMRTRHKGDGLTTAEFLLCAVWGFLLASTTFAPTVQSFISAFAAAVGGH